VWMWVWVVPTRSALRKSSIISGMHGCSFRVSPSQLTYLDPLKNTPSGSG
jgi:hypothetical protein